MGLVLVGGCAIDAAPATLDEAIGAWWRSSGSASDAELGEVLRGTLDAIDVDAIARSDERGNQTRLSADDVAGLDFFDAGGEPRTPPDPSLARPVYLIERLDCTLDAFTRVIAHEDQAELYGDLGHYESYERTYFTSKDDFVSGATSTLSWQGTLDTRSILFEYAYTFRVEARRVPAPDDLDVPGGHVLVTRDWMPFPATAISGQVAFDQDYQLEVAIPLPDGGLLHVYPVWRQISTALGTMESEAVASFNLDQMVGWGKRTEQWCADGVPE